MKMKNQVILFGAFLLVTLNLGLCLKMANPSFDFGIIDSPPTCQCSSYASCERKHWHPADPTDKKVMVMSGDRKTPWKDWNWEVISTVISSEGPNKDLMCYTHMKGKQYGFVVKLSGFREMVNGTDLIWISKKVRLAKDLFADFLLFNLLETLNEKDLNTTHLSEFLKSFAHSLHGHARGTNLICLLPWNPEFLRGDDQGIHTILLNTLVRYCEKFVTDSDSYLTPSESCRARATVPFTKLIYGVDEYVAQGVPVERFFLGVPWHGFDYTCDTFDKKTNSCLLQPANVTECDYNGARNQLSLGIMRDRWPKTVMRISGHEWERYTMSPYFTYTDKASGKIHEVRFEDMHSLTLKYHLSRELDMGGVLIYSVDDLIYGKSEEATTYDKLMWNMLKDAMFKPIRSSYFMDQFKAFPSKMAGVGVGCMLLGTVLGFVLGAVICVRRQRKTLRPPFLKDHPQQYQDEDPSM